jgi:hypothetical protein
MRRNLVVAVIIFLLALLASSVAWANGSHHGHQGHGGHGFSHHGHHHHHARANVDIVIGAPLFGYPYYRPRYYAQPPYYVYAYPPAVAYSSPPVYIERGDEGTQEGNQIQPAPAFWYFCSEPRGYYPYVSQCPKGWQQVPAQPPANP